MSTATPPGQRVSHPALAALSAALGRWAAFLGEEVDGLQVGRLEAMEWPDSCLGLPGDQEGCADVVTPGYRIDLGGMVYHADQHGNVRRDVTQLRPDTEILLSYTVEGGITGGSRSFHTDSYRLSETDETQLRRLVREADFFTVEPGPTGPAVPDGITRRLRIGFGRGGHEVVRGDGIAIEDSSAFHALVAWVEERTPPSAPRGATAGC